MTIHLSSHHGSTLVLVLCLILVVVLLFFCIDLYEASQLPPRPPPDDTIPNRLSESSPILIVTNAVKDATKVKWILQTSTDLVNWMDRPNGLPLDWFTNRCGFWRFREDRQ